MSLDLSRIAARYKEMSDEELLHELRNGPGAFASPQVWETITAEARRRGFPDTQIPGDDNDPSVLLARLVSEPYVEAIDGSFGDTPRRVDPEVLARMLYNEFIEGTIGPPDSGLDSAILEDAGFVTQSRLFRAATFILALELARQQTPGFVEVQMEFERLVFSTSPEEAYPHLEEVRAAMKALGALIDATEEQQELSWSRLWFESAGIPVDNPADLALHAESWIDYWVTANNTLADPRLQPQ